MGVLRAPALLCVSVRVAHHLKLLQCTISLACCRTLNTETNKILGKGSAQKHKFSRIPAGVFCCAAGSDWIELDWIGLDRIGSDWMGVGVEVR